MGNGYPYNYHVPVSDVDNNEIKATKQGKVILKFFQDNKGKKFTPFEVNELCFKNTVPITSVRRAITNLTKRGQLIKLSEYKNGNYKHPNHLWTIPVEYIQGKLF